MRLSRAQTRAEPAPTHYVHSVQTHEPTRVPAAVAVQQSNPRCGDSPHEVLGKLILKIITPHLKHISRSTKNMGRMRNSQKLTAGPGAACAPAPAASGRHAGEGGANGRVGTVMLTNIRSISA